MKHVVGLLTSVLLLFPAWSQSEVVEQPSDGNLNLIVARVSDSLEIKPVPKWGFTITPADGAPALQVTTSFAGTASITLSAGRYSLSSNQPLELDERTFAWQREFEIVGGEELVLELSNDNATIEVSTKQAQRIVTEEGSLYQTVKDRVFKVLSGSGHGSGFLIDSDAGLVATNHHVIVDSEYLAVKVSDHRKYAAKVIVKDEVHDVAIIQIHPSAVAELQPVALANDTPDRAAVQVGDRVLAIGSPLATETILTTGIVSKVEEGAIFSDVNINQGNSGGPLFSSQREVIGINTFGLVSSGPGLAGIVRVHRLLDLVKLTANVDLNSPPSDSLLPVEPSFRFPAKEIRQAALESNARPHQYHIEAGKFDVQLLTPTLIASLQVADEKAAAAYREKRTKRAKRKRDRSESKPYTPGRDFYEWRKYAGDYRAVVTIQAVPEIALTGGSAFAVVMIGSAAHQKFRFKADFDRMELWRGDVLVRPIHPRRWANVKNFNQGNASMSDVGFYGSYEYPPEAFKPGEELKLKVWRQGREKPITKTISTTQQHRVWEDFEMYFEALKAEEAARNSD